MVELRVKTLGSTLGSSDQLTSVVPDAHILPTQPQRAGSSNPVTNALQVTSSNPIRKGR